MKLNENTAWIENGINKMAPTEVWELEWTIVLTKVRKARYFAAFVYLGTLFIIDGFIAEFNLRSSSLIYLDVSPFYL